MPNIYQGKLTVPQGRFAVVVSRFNESITSRLLDGAVETLVSHGVDEADIDVAWVPGAFEIPVAAEHFSAAGKHKAVICLGAVIRGETTHDRYINQAVSVKLADIGIRHNLPVLFGLLTCNTLEQAIDRSGGRLATTGKDAVDAHLGNKGIDCAEAALEMVDLMSKLPC